MELGTFIFYSRREDAKQRMIRKSVVVFDRSHDGDNVFSIGESSLWSGRWEEIEGYIYVGPKANRCQD